MWNKIKCMCYQLSINKINATATYTPANMIKLVFQEIGNIRSIDGQV